jgi:hypothetical protein
MRPGLLPPPLTPSAQSLFLLFAGKRFEAETGCTDAHRRPDSSCRRPQSSHRCPESSRCRPKSGHLGLDSPFPIV